MAHAATTSPPAKRHKVLVIDGDPATRSTLEANLSGPYEVIACATAQEGIAAVDHLVHAVILDIDLHDKDGFWTYEIIKNRFPELPIILFSAFRDVADPYDIVNRYRPFSYVRKGGDLGELIVVVGQAARHYEQHLRREAQLLVADRLAAVGTLAAGAAHEINNPLGYIAGNIEYLLDELPAMKDSSTYTRWNEIERALHSTLEGAHRIASIVRDLKSFSRTREALGDESADVHIALDLAVRMAENEIKHRARLVRQYGVVPQVRADSQRLAQIFLNLLVNAAQALPIGDADHHEIRVTTSADGRNRVIVELRDTGPGIPDEIRTRIFDPFFTTKAPNVGTGLGLFVTHNLVQAVGGSIYLAESQAGRGTTFQVALPAAPVSIDSDAAIRPPPPDSPEKAGKRLRILAIDDEPLVGQMIRRLLPMHEVFIKEDGRAAVELCRHEDIDIILCDVMMPNFSGVDVYETLQREQPGMERRIVFLSGGVFENNVEEYLARLDNPKLDKPIRRATLLRAIEQHFGVG